ncbi:MAG TPA: di-heme oxidoredictase family protein [Bryobacteraceae bacterium]|nr:di-heme oxidoredictase family protein [Bryobacteraceae bacterium]
MKSTIEWLFLIRVFWLVGAMATSTTFAAAQPPAQIGREVAIPEHLQDGEEYELSIAKLIRYGQRLFEAHFTSEEGAGRPLTKGTGGPLSDQGSPLLFPRNNNRISGPESNSCSGCHNQPIAGGTGDLSTNVFVMANRFDFATFDGSDRAPTRGAVDERGMAVTLQSIANSRATPGMFGSGYYEMLARQITADLQSIRDAIQPGGRARLMSKGISFGVLARKPDGFWNTSEVEGLPPESVASIDAQHPPSLLILPFSQAGAVVSLRQFTVNAFNQHHGMQATERFGIGTDPDGDGVVNELTRADITACTLFEATMAVPGRAISNDPAIQAAVQDGEKLFRQIGCASCHIPALPLDWKGWIYTEPNPYNPPGNLQVGQAPTLSVDLTGDELPQPRLKPVNGVVMVPLYTDFKLHDICRGPDDPNREVLNQNQPAGSPEFFAGNEKFLTRRLWAVGSMPNYFHHGQFTTIREAILNHFGEALQTQQAFSRLSSYEQGAVIEFLKSLQVIPTGP